MRCTFSSFLYCGPEPVLANALHHPSQNRDAAFWVGGGGEMSGAYRPSSVSWGSGRIPSAAAAAPGDIDIAQTDSSTPAGSQAYQTNTTT
jgi:hypothetical protein